MAFPPASTGLSSMDGGLGSFGAFLREAIVGILSKLSITFLPSAEKLYQLYPIPKRAENQVRLPRVVDNQIGVNSIPVGFSRKRLDDVAVIGPVELRIGRIERFIGCQSNARSVFSKRRNRIIQVIFVVEKRNIGCPYMPFESPALPRRPIWADG